MKVLLNEQGYVESYALEGELVDALETAEEDLSQMTSGSILRNTSLPEAAKAEYRRHRVGCFPIINRGQLWYALSEGQLWN